MSFERGFDANGTRNMRQHVLKTKRFSRPGRKGKTAFRLRRRERIEGRALQETTKKTYKETRLANQHAQDVFVLQKTVKKSHRKKAFWDTFGSLWMTKTARSRDKLGHRSHHAQGLGKHAVFDGPGA